MTSSFKRHKVRAYEYVWQSVCSPFLATPTVIVLYVRYTHYLMTYSDLCAPAALSRQPRCIARYSTSQTSFRQGASLPMVVPRQWIQPDSEELAKVTSFSLALASHLRQTRQLGDEHITVYFTS